MAFTEIYVDPSIAADSGTGTVGDPFGDLEYAIEQSTFDTTNGTRVNIKAGTDEVLAAPIDDAMADTVTTVAWAPSATAPCIFQGYTTTAGDGGQGGVSGGGLVSVYDSTTIDFVYFCDLHLHNVGSNYIVRFDDLCGVYNCELNNSSTGGISGTANCYAVGNYIHDVGINGVASFNQASLIAYNHFSGSFTTAIALCTGTIYRNIVSVTGSSDGISVSSGAVVINNSVYSSGGTGQGIQDSAQTSVIMNNMVEGFSGTGGIGYDLDAQNIGVFAYGGNAAYNNATNYAGPNDVIYNYGDNETLSASPFTSAGTGDFSPVDTGNVKEGALPQIIGGGLV